MSSEHGPVNQMSIGEIADFLRKLLPQNIEKAVRINPMFKTIASDEKIWKGVLSYRDFLMHMFDTMRSSGHTYFKLKNKPKSTTDYPFLYALSDLFSDVGYYGELSSDGLSMVVKKLPSFTSYIDKDGNKKSSKNSVRMLKDCLNFLEATGVTFKGIDLQAKKFSLGDQDSIEVSYSSPTDFFIGLKVMAIADIELRQKRYKNDFNHDNILRCDYRLLNEAYQDKQVALKNYLIPVSPSVQTLLVNLHKTCIDMGATCVENISTFDVHFAYAIPAKSRKPLTQSDLYKKRIWEISISAKHGYCLVVRSKKTNMYSDFIETLPLPLKEKISNGYGCDRKLHKQPCQGGCEGIRFPLDDSFLSSADHIIRWIEKETACRIGR